MKASNRIKEARKQIRIASNDIQINQYGINGTELTPDATLDRVEGILAELQIMIETLEMKDEEGDEE